MGQATQGSEFYLMGEEIRPITTSSDGHDAFHWMGEMNKASAVMLAEQGVIRAPLAKIIANAVTQVLEAGAAPGDHQLLRQIKAICSRLPALDTKRFHDESLRDFHNTLLVAYLGCITKGTGLVNDVVDKYNLAYDKHSRRRGIF